MRTDNETCLRDFARYLLKNEQFRESDVKIILDRHCETKEEMKEFFKYLQSKEGLKRFKEVIYKLKARN